MKKISVAILFSIISIIGANAQVYLPTNYQDTLAPMFEELKLTLKEDANGLYYERIIEVPGATQADNMSAIKIFFTENHGSGRVVMDLIDDHSGVIIGKANVGIDEPITMSTYAKDGKVKAILRPNDYPTFAKFYRQNGKLKQLVEYYYNWVHPRCLAYLEAFEYAIRTQGGTNGSDW